MRFTPDILVEPCLTDRPVIVLEPEVVPVLTLQGVATPVGIVSADDESASG